MFPALSCLQGYNKVMYRQVRRGDSDSLRTSGSDFFMRSWKSVIITEPSLATHGPQMLQSPLRVRTPLNIHVKEPTIYSDCHSDLLHKSSYNLYPAKSITCTSFPRRRYAHRTGNGFKAELEIDGVKRYSPPSWMTNSIGNERSPSWCIGSAPMWPIMTLI